MRRLVSGNPEELIATTEHLESFSSFETIVSFVVTVVSYDFAMWFLELLAFGSTTADSLRVLTFDVAILVALFLYGVRKRGNRIATSVSFFRIYWWTRVMVGIVIVFAIGTVVSMVAIAVMVVITMPSPSSVPQPTGLWVASAFLFFWTSYLIIYPIAVHTAWLSLRGQASLCLTESMQKPAPPDFEAGWLRRGLDSVAAVLRQEHKILVSPNALILAMNVKLLRGEDTRIIIRQISSGIMHNAFDARRDLYTAITDLNQTAATSLGQGLVVVPSLRERVASLLDILVSLAPLLSLFLVGLVALTGNRLSLP